MKKQLRRFSLILVGSSLLFLTPSFSKLVVPEDPDKPLVTLLENGMEVAIKHVPRSKRVSCQLWVKAGSITEGDKIGSGISHYLEHLLFKGTEKRGVAEIAQEIEHLGGSINAYTSFNRTVFSIQLPAEYLDQALDILADAAVHAVIDPAEFEKERKVILQEISYSSDDPEKKVSRLLWQNAFRTHPYRFPVIGYKSVFEKITREDVLDYYKSRYIPNNMLLVVAGNVLPEKALVSVKRYFSPLERRSLAPETLPQEPLQLGSRTLIVDRDLQKTYFYLSFHGPNITSLDVAPIDVLAVILGQGRSSRLYKKLREEKNLVYSVEAWSYTPKEPGLFAFYATIAPENLYRVKEAIWEEIKKVQKEGVSETEIQKAQATLLKDVLSSVETSTGQASTLGSNLFSAENPLYDRLYLRQVMEVTPAEVTRVAQTYFSEEKEALTVLGPRELMPSPPTSKKAISDLGEIQKKILPNGVTLLVRPDPGRALVYLKAVLQGGVLSETEKTSGISHLLSQLFLKGTKTKSRTEFMDQLEFLGGDISPYGGYNSFGIEMSVLSQNWEEGLSMLVEVIQEPRFEMAELEKEKKVTLVGIRAREDEPFDAASKLLRETLFLKHPYRMQRLGNEQSVSQLTIKDVEAYHKKHVSPKNLVLAIVGDVDPLKVETYAETLFNGFHSSKGPRFKKWKQVAQKKIKKEVKWKDSHQAILAMGFHTVDLYDSDQYPLEIIASIYSGQGSRLFKSVREEKGLAYSVGAYNVLGLDPGFFTFYVGTRPDKTQEVIEILLNEIRLLKEKGITEVELERAKNGLVGQHQKELENSSQFAFKIALDELYGLGADDYKQYESRIRAVTSADVIRTARKFFNENAYTLVEVKPKLED